MDQAILQLNKKFDEMGQLIAQSAKEAKKVLTMLRQTKKDLDKLVKLTR